MKVRIEFMDGQVKEFVGDSSGVEEGAMWVLLTRHGDRVDRYPLVNIRTWSTDR